MTKRIAPKTYRKEKTVTRSISFEQDVFDELERRREDLRMTRSEFLRAVLEDSMGILVHPELRMAPGTRKVQDSGIEDPETIHPEDAALDMELIAQVVEATLAARERKASQQAYPPSPAVKRAEDRALRGPHAQPQTARRSSPAGSA